MIAPPLPVKTTWRRRHVVGAARHLVAVTRTIPVNVRVTAPVGKTMFHQHWAATVTLRIAPKQNIQSVPNSVKLRHTLISFQILSNYTGCFKITGYVSCHALRHWLGRLFFGPPKLFSDTPLYKANECHVTLTGPRSVARFVRQRSSKSRLSD